jgi:ketosteroid isomerase-like protein
MADANGRFDSPLDTIIILVEARDRGEIELALSCYERQATILLSPTQVDDGKEPIRASLEGFVAMRPRFEVSARRIVQGEGVALHYSSWTLAGTGPDGEPLEFSGTSTDVLRRQPDGSWLVAIDNPYGIAVVG